MNDGLSLLNNINKPDKKNKCPLIILPPHFITLNRNSIRNSTTNKNKWNITSVQKADECFFSKLKIKNESYNTKFGIIDKLNYSNPIQKKKFLMTSTNTRDNSKDTSQRHFRIYSKPLNPCNKSKEDAIKKDYRNIQRKKMLTLCSGQNMQMTSTGFNSNFQFILSSTISPKNNNTKLLKPMKDINNPDIERIKEVVSQKSSGKALFNISNTYLFFYKIGPVIGRGAFGKINLCLHILSNQLVAIKSFNKTHKKFSYDKIYDEVDLMKALTNYSYLDNPIIEFYEMFETGSHVCIVMEYVNGNDLLSLVRKKRLNENKAKFIFQKVVQGIRLIHNKKIIHRDIKLENILIGEDSKIKICDFGIAKMITKKGEIFKDRCGTLNYIAPEIIKSKGYNGEYSDLWSLGIVLFTMLFGKIPYKFDKETKKIDYNISHDYSKISPKARDLIQRLLIIDKPDKRIPLNDILNHQWLENVDPTPLFCKRENDFLKKRWELDEIEFNEDNIITIELDKKEKEKEKESKKSKSIILAPFNTAFDEENEKITEIMKDHSLRVFKEKQMIIFNPNVKEDNISYMLNNNNDADNGVYLTLNEENVVEAKKAQNETKRIDNIASFHSTNNSIKNQILSIMEDYGYEKEFIINCIQKKEFNHATTTYFLLLKKMKNDQKEPLYN